MCIVFLCSAEVHLDKNKKHIISLLSAKIVRRLLKVKVLSKIVADRGLIARLNQVRLVVFPNT